MIITRAPLRITFVGGGTDIRNFFEKENGAVVNAAINKYVYITLNKKFESGILIKYSQTENVSHVDELKHPLFREALKYVGITDGVEISSHADIPSSGSGLGSSSAFLVALLQALWTYKGEYKTPSELAKAAVHIEREILKEHGGLQDQYICAHGGLRYMEFHDQGQVNVSHIHLMPEYYASLQKRLMMFYTGETRKSDKIQETVIVNMNHNLDKLRNIKWQAIRLKDELHRGNHELVGNMMHEYWKMKKQLASGISKNQMDEYYEKAIAAGALGGKILGAGGGGFFLFYVPEENQLAVRSALQPLKQLNFKLESEGSKILYVSENSLEDMKLLSSLNNLNKNAQNNFSPNEMIEASSQNKKQNEDSSAEDFLEVN